jgi:putative membrane protein insertion efficiency factor
VNSTTTSQSLAARIRSAIVFVLLLPVHAYRRVISPLIAPRCRYYPTCSSYAVEALKTYGPLRGTVLAAWRVVRCNPFNEGGFDHVEDQKLFRRRGHGHGPPCDEHHNHGVTT